MSSTKDTADKLEIADKESIDAELQVGALKREQGWQISSMVNYIR